MFDNYTEMDRLVLERWPEVMGLIDAHEKTQDAMEDALKAVGDRVLRWVREQGFDGEMSARDAELDVWRPAWYDKRKEEPKVYLTLGGFCPLGFRKVEDNFPYLWVRTYPLERYKLKEPDRVKFAQALRAALGEDARNWDADDVEDADHPLGRYLRQYDESARARLLLDPDAFVSFCKEHLPALFALSNMIDAELQRVNH